MSDIRGEKVTFRKEDIVALHSLPSAQAHDPCIVHSPAQRRWVRSLAKVAFGFLCLVGVLFGVVLAAIETGAFDGVLNARAQTALNAALGDAYRAEVGGTVVRLNGSGGLALKARDVTLIRNQDNETLVTTDQMFIELDIAALLSGRVAVSRIEAEGAQLAASFLPRGKALDLTAMRIAGVGAGMETVFSQMDAISALIARSGTEVVRIADVTLPLSAPRNRVVEVNIHTLDFTRRDDGAMRIDGDLAIDGQEAALHLTAETDKGRIVRFGGSATGLPMAALLHRAATATEPAFGIRTGGAISIAAGRAIDGAAPELKMTGRLDQGLFEAGGLASDLQPSVINLAYNFERGSIDLIASTLGFGRSVLPFSGALSDIDTMEPNAAAGFAINLLVKDGWAAPIDVNEPPLPIDVAVTGKFLSSTHALVFDQLAVSSPQGSLAGSLSIQFSETSPQISFVGLTNDMQSTGVKQLWPWWVGKKARAWVIGNVYGGKVRNAKIEVAIQRGRMAATSGPIELSEDELKIDFDIEDARVNLAGDIPPLRDAAGHMRLRGDRLDVRIDGGTAYFPSGRQVMLNGGDFAIPGTYSKPLMAEMKLQVSGGADAIAELVSYRPLEALQKTPFKADDFEGPMTADVGARFGLSRDQNPPPPQWQTEMILKGVTLKTPIAGRQISKIDGLLRIDPEKAVLAADADVDGIPMSLDVVEPVGANSPAKRRREVSGTLADGALAKFAPGLDEIVSGPLAVDLTIGDDDRQTVTADLQGATLSLPWVGWSKGKGIAAKVDFTAESKDGVTRINDLKLAGDNFGARGDLSVDKAGLASANFSAVQLAAGDNYAVAVTRQKNGYSVLVNGTSADVRPVIDSIKSPSGGGSGDAPAKRISIEGSLGQMQGFHSEALSNVKLNYTARGRDIEGVNLSAVTKSGQAVVAELVPSGADNILQLTSGDAGALARFADIYANMRGGLLNLRLRDRGAGSWRGTVDIRKFSLVDEARLQSMVSSPSTTDGRSLNQAVRKDIDVSTARFDRGFASLALDGGRIAVADGVVRGTDIGATFQGVVRDAKGNMDMTGTFMPAYGLNRLFGELPLIGTLLGNGRDRGLLGITFKVTGSFARPNLLINPLSIIAPGVFRSIFEFN